MADRTHSGSTHSESTPPTPLWSPDSDTLASCQLTTFATYLEHLSGIHFNTYHELHAYSICHANTFWRAIWHFFKIKGHLNEESENHAEGNAHAASTVRRNAHTEQLPFYLHHWFPNSTLNFAENLLEAPACQNKPAHIALEGHDERGLWRQYTRPELREAVIRLACYLQQQGIQPGDRIAGYLPNVPEAIIAMLATTALGAIWTSCSPDFGVNSVLDRFSQVTPRLLFTVDGYYHKGKPFPIVHKIQEIAQQLPSLIGIIVLPYFEQSSNSKNANHSNTPASAQTKEYPPRETWDVCLNSTTPSAITQFVFHPFPFKHPVFILYSSGTTGKPKCLVHGAGGTLLQHLKELVLHTDVKPTDRLLYYTSCGWMMWNWMASTLATGASLITYEGAPAHPKTDALLRVVAQHDITIWGTSARYLHAVCHAGITQKTVDLSAVQCLLSTGSPLAAADFEYLYQHLTPHARLCSISGGTDIISCFVLGCPWLPIYAGQIQCPGLGMAVEIWNEAGQKLSPGYISPGHKGELVCTQPFPSMPVFFWNDPGHTRYQQAYFNRFPGIWAHGDSAEFTPEHGIIIHGRSDSMLNPQGVRIGTAEIYNPVEQLPGIAECLAAPYNTTDGDSEIILFVVPAKNKMHDEEALKQQIRQAIINYASPRHVPKHTYFVHDLPKTHSGKLMEALVKQLINGDQPTTLSAVSNPTCLSIFRDLHQELSKS